MVFYECGMKLTLDPHECIIYLTIFKIPGIVFAPVEGRALQDPLPPSLVNTPFLQMGFGVGVWVILI